VTDLPKGWALLPLADIRRNSAIYHHAQLEMYSWDFELHGEARALARAKAGAMLALLDWLEHEAAVEAQDEEAQDEVKP